VVDYGKNSLSKPGIKNAKTLAETRKINAEATAIELDNELKKQKIALDMAKISLLQRYGKTPLLLPWDDEDSQKLLTNGEEGTSSPPT